MNRHGQGEAGSAPAEFVLVMVLLVALVLGVLALVLVGAVTVIGWLVKRPLF